MKINNKKLKGKIKIQQFYGEYYFNFLKSVLIGKNNFTYLYIGITVDELNGARMFDFC